METVNNNQKHYISKKIKSVLGDDLSDYTFAIWGLAFKPETDDMREASSIIIIKDLLEAGATINAYDPKAMDTAKNFYLKDSDINYYEDKYSVLHDADAIVLVTEWKEFRSPNFDKIKTLLKQPLIFDGRNQYNNKLMKKLDFKYYAVGK